MMEYLQCMDLKQGLLLQMHFGIAFLSQWKQYEKHNPGNNTLSPKGWIYSELE